MRSQGRAVSVFDDREAGCQGPLSWAERLDVREWRIVNGLGLVDGRTDARRLLGERFAALGFIAETVVGTGAVVMGVTAKHPYIVAYLMPSGKAYIKSLTQADADSLMQVDMQKSFNSEGQVFNSFGF